MTANHPRHSFARNFLERGFYLLVQKAEASSFFFHFTGATYMLMKLEIMSWFMLITLKIECYGINLDVYEKALLLVKDKLSEKFFAVM
jgi:hypothetical protein